MLRIIKKGMGILTITLISLALFSGPMAGCRDNKDDKLGLALLLLLALNRPDSCGANSTSAFITIPCGVAQ